MEKLTHHSPSHGQYGVWKGLKVQNVPWQEQKIVVGRDAQTSRISPTARVIYLDTRSPSEYAEDHIPGAINTPVLNDQERMIIGTFHKHKTRFARLLGAQWIADNISRMIQTKILPAMIDAESAQIFTELHHLQNIRADTEKLNALTQHDIKALSRSDIRPFDQEFCVYCARGGQRSQSMASVLSRVGYKVSVLEKGYKTYREQVVQQTRLIMDHVDTVVLLQGPTNSGKSMLLEMLREQHGAFTLNLEEAAQHFGSILGFTQQHHEMSQKEFETRIWHQLVSQETGMEILRTFGEGSEANGTVLSGNENTMTSSPQPKRRVLFVESEAQRLGKFLVPDTVWKRMKNSQHIINIRPVQDARVQHCRARYAHFESPGYALELQNALRIVRKVIASRDQDTREERESNLYIIDEIWPKYIQNGQWEPLIRELMQLHYDPAYENAIERMERRDTFKTFRPTEITPESYEKLSREIVSLILQ